MCNNKSRVTRQTVTSAKNTKWLLLLNTAWQTKWINGQSSESWMGNVEKLDCTSKCGGRINGTK